MQSETQAPTDLVRVAGVFLALGPLLSLLGPLFESRFSELSLVPGMSLQAFQGGLLGCSFLVSLGGLLMTRFPSWGRWLLLSVGLLWAVLVLRFVRFEPLTVLVVSASFVWLWHLLWPSRLNYLASGLLPAVSHARGAGWVLLLCAGLIALFGAQLHQGSLIALAISSGIVSLLLVRGALLRLRDQKLLFWLSLLSLGGVFVALSFIQTGRVSARWVVALLLLPALLAVIGLKHPRVEIRVFTELLDRIASHPARLLVATFAALSALGGLLLSLPLASAQGSGLSPMDALFTATSAVCVNGLQVIDIATELSPTGQIISLVLIQVGGLGIMTFSTAVVGVFGRRLSLRHEAAMADLLYSQSQGQINQLLKVLLGVTLFVEIFGALALWPFFMQAGEGYEAALWRAVYTSISAFCNAGFALQSTSLIPYASSPAILNIVAVLVILGGLSPLIILELPRWFKRRQVSLQARLVVISTLILLGSGAVFIGALEWGHGFSHLSLGDRAQAAWYQSVTLRSAGFNSVEFSELRPATLWLMCVYMFIGGSPGGTAGGIKTTTVAVLLIAVGSAMRGRWEAVAYGRRLPAQTVYKAAAITTVALGFLVTGVVAVSVTQEQDFLLVLFDVVAALSGAGLSAGATSRFDEVGKAILMVLMLVGRVGPLTLFLFLSDRQSTHSWETPEEEVAVG